MKIPSIRRILSPAVLAAAAAMLLPFRANAVIEQINAAETFSYTMGYKLINEKLGSTTKLKVLLAAEVNGISYLFGQINTWERKYSDYLQQAEGLASNLNASVSLYMDCCDVFFALNQIRKSCMDNPEGIVASIPMSRLYFDTAAELADMYDFVSKSLAKGGKENMLNGRSRAQLLWSMEDKVKRFAQHLNKIAYSIRFYTRKHAINKLVRGWYYRNPAEIARMARDDWERAAETSCDHEFINPDFSSWGGENIVDEYKKLKGLL